MNRQKKGIFTGIVGTICNLLLAITKLVIGFISGSISIQSDAINNFGDVISSIAISVSFFISGKKADKDHPFGHGRIEYAISFAIAIIIIIVAIEFVISSVKKIISPTAIEFSWLFFIIIALAILIKLIMGVYYHYSDKKLDSPTIKAAKIDSFQDVLISSATLISFALSGLTSLPIDGIIGLAISIFIVINGINLIRATMDKILGCNANKTLASKIMAGIMAHPEVLGAHDLMIHDYGKSNTIASVHVELPSDLILNDAHRITDDIEKSIKDENGVELVAHIDPVDTNDTLSKEYRSKIRKMLVSINPALSFHDFRLDKKLNKITIDIVIPFNLEIQEQTIIEELNKLDFDAFTFQYIIDYQ